MQKSEFRIDAAQAGGRIDVVVSELSGLTRSQVQKLIEHGHLTVNNSAMKPNYKARIGDVISIFFSEEKQELIAEDLPIQVVHLRH